MRWQRPDIEATYFLPLVRRALAQELYRKGHSQNSIARQLQLTQAAVSHYVNDNSATTILPDDILAEIQKMAHQLDTTTHKEFTEWLSHLCQTALQKGTLCDIHKQHESVPENCDICFAWSQ